jgi:TRAP-type C4-dicarboxylate transport system permease small subunit
VKIGRLLGLLEAATSAMGGAFLILITTLTFIGVLGRYFFGFALGFSGTLITLMMGWGVYLLVGSVARRDEHVRIAFLIQWVLGQRAKSVYHALENIVSLGLCSLLIYAGYLLIASYREIGQVSMFMPTASGSIKYPAWIDVIVIPLGFFIAALFYMERIINQIRSLRRRQREPHANSEEDRS